MPGMAEAWSSSLDLLHRDVHPAMGETPPAVPPYSLHHKSLYPQSKPYLLIICISHRQMEICMETAFNISKTEAFFRFILLLIIIIVINRYWQIVDIYLPIFDIADILFSIIMSVICQIILNIFVIAIIMMNILTS